MNIDHKRVFFGVGIAVFGILVGFGLASKHYEVGPLAELKGNSSAAADSCQMAKMALRMAEDRYSVEGGSYQPVANAKMAADDACFPKLRGTVGGSVRIP